MKRFNIILAIIIVVLPVLSIFVIPKETYASSLNLVPNGDSDIEWSRSGGATNFSCIDETVASDADYVYKDLGTYTDIYDLQDSGGISGTISYVKMYIRGKVTNATAGSYKGLLYISSNYYKTDAYTNTVFTTNTYTWATDPSDGLAWTWADIDALKVGVEGYLITYPPVSSVKSCSMLYIEVGYASSAPTVDTAAASNTGDTFTDLNGEITAVGGASATERGFAWSTTSNSTTPTADEVPPASYTTNWTEVGTFGTGTFSHNVTSFLGCTTYYYRAYAYNGVGWGWGDEVEFSTLCSPSITTLDPIYVEATTARLRARLDDDGNQACDVRFLYGTVSGNCTYSTNCTTATCNATTYATATAWVENTYTSGSIPYVDIGGLVAGTTYYVCAQARNDYQCVCGGQISFATVATISEPSNMVGIPTATSISLKWVKGTGSTNTYIRAKTSDYPTSLADGTLVYDDELSSYLWTGLNPGETWYFRAWGESGGTYSTDNLTLIVTTLAIAAGYDDQPTPTTPDAWYQAPDYTRMSNMPFYGIANWWADSFQMDRSTLWFIMAMVLSVLFGILLYFISGGKALIGIFTVVIAMGLSSFMGLMSLWLLFPALLLAIGAVVIGERL